MAASEDNIECTACSMFVSADAVWCPYCGSKTYTRDKISSNVRYAVGELHEHLDRIKIRDKERYPEVQQDLVAFADEVGPIFYDALATLMLNKGNERLLRSRLATVLFLLHRAFEDHEEEDEAGPYRSAPAPESPRTLHLKQLDAALQRHLSVIHGEPVRTEVQLLGDLARHEQVTPYDRLLLMEYACYFCVYLDREEQMERLLDQLAPLVPLLDADGLQELCWVAAYFKAPQLHPALRRLLDETDDVQLKKEIARYLRRVDRLDDDAVSNVVAAIHEDVDLQEVDANMAHLTFILGLELDMLTKRTFALPVLKAIRLYGTRRQKEWANRKYRKAILL